MGLLNTTNLKSLIEIIPHNTIVTAKWLQQNGVSRQLLLKYKQGNWFEKLTNGVFVKIGDNADLDGAIYALQRQVRE